MLASNSKTESALDIWHANSQICRLQKIRTKLDGLVRRKLDKFIHVFTVQRKQGHPVPCGLCFEQRSCEAVPRMPRAIVESAYRQFLPETGNRSGCVPIPVLILTHSLAKQVLRGWEQSKDSVCGSLRAQLFSNPQTYGNCVETLSGLDNQSS
ncbi:hypothetical protein QQF64_019228 [Cirrhinus molitorella]|uniref:Reverse transcriptase n=1 Tax=Cirrhinus molitorella TaxID=172907 RepID=A0ABR3LEV2_9TELE